MKTIHNVLLGVLCVAIVGIGLYLFVVADRSGSDPVPAVSSFAECVEAGYPVLDSYPEQCETPDGQRFEREVDDVEVPADVAEHIRSKADRIVITEPRPMSVVSSPLTFRGEARGMWYFEADFPVVLVDWDGRIIAEGYASAVLDPDDPDATWMTEAFVAFEGTLEFENPSWDAEFSRRGSLILQRDNPSGLPEHDDALEIPVRFEAQQAAAPGSEEVTMRGTVVCLPHRDTDGPQTLECAFGIRDASGTYYALRDPSPDQQLISSVATDSEVEVSGVLEVGEHERYQSAGVLEIRSIFPREVSTGGCYVGGCSGQLCSDRQDVASTCEWREEYACYQQAQCERQADGQCGWTQTNELMQCLANAR